MVKIEWGAKRTCLNCGARFYDLQKTSPACPKCNTVYEIYQPTRGRRGKAAALDLTKDLLLEDVVVDLDFVADMGTDLIEDTDDLSEGLDDIPEALTEDSDE